MIDTIQIYLHPDRHYHSIHHISNMLANSNHFDLSQNERVKLHNAIVYHDIVYDPESKTNEEDSARFFMNDLISGNVTFDKNEMKMNELGGAVWVMIHSTKDHIPTSDMCKYLIDLDLWDLADDTVYLKNRDLVRKEYHMYSDDEWVEGRKKWIDSMLSKDKIFHTDYCRRYAFDQKARENLSNEWSYL